MICTAWYQWLLTNWEQTKISFPFTKLMSDWSYKKKPPLCFHTLFRFVSPYECNAISSSVFFSFNINPIQWQWNPDIHFIHKSDQSQPLLCPYVRITFPQKSLILIMHPAHFLVCPLKYLHTSCMPHDTTWNPQKSNR